MLIESEFAMKNLNSSSCHHSKTLSATTCILLLFLSGCGGSPSEDLLTPYGDEGATSGANHGSGQSNSPAVSTVDPKVYSDVARQATEYLNGMSAEYEGFYGSGQANVQLKRTAEMYQLLEPASQQLSNTSAPPLDVAQKLKTESLPSLLEAIKRAELANLHFEREYSTSMFGHSPFGNRGHEIRDGIQAARRILDKIQFNMPVAERLTTGEPPTIGGPPATNRSFGYLRGTDLDSSQYRSMHHRGQKSDMVPWRLRVDPPSHPYEIQPESQIELDAPGAEAIPTPFYNPVNVLYPVMPSLHVGVGLNEIKGNQRQVWSLDPRLRKGIVKSLQLQKSDVMALSADGMYFAARPEKASVIGLYDVKKGEAVGQIENEYLPQTREHLFFAADNRLVLFNGATVQVWSVPTLKPERLIKMNSLQQWHSRTPGYNWSISPGGRYLAVPSTANFNYEVRIFDLITGETAAKIALTRENHVSNISASFSKDGAKLAVVIESPWNSWIQIWDVVAGRLLASYSNEVQLSGAMSGDNQYQGPSIDWFPDGKRILIYGKGIFDTQAGQGTRLITSTVRYPVRPLGGDYVGVLMNKKLVGFDLKEIPETPVRWKSDALVAETVVAENPFAIVQEGSRPAPLATNRSSVTDISLPENSHWNVIADSANSVPINAVNIPNFTGQHLYQTVLASDHDRIVAGYTDRQPRIWDGKVADLGSLKSWVEYADLSNQSQPTKFEFPFPSGFQAVSPNGSRLLTRDLDGFNRFDIWDLDAQKHLAGFIPYAQGRSDGGAPILWAEFIDEGHVLTLGESQLTCWSVPQGEAIFEVEVSGVEAWPALSPGRQQIALLNGKSLTIISSITGEVLGYRPNLELNGSLAAVSFRPDGKELAVLSSPVGGGELALIDLSTGEIQTSFPIPLVGKVLEWCQNDYVLIDGGYCISLEKHAVAWIYQLDGVRIDSGGRDTKLFFTKSAYNSPLTLMSQVLPTPETITAVASQDPPNGVILAAGGSIALDIQVPNPPNRSNFNEEVRTALTAKFAEQGISISAAAQLTLSVRGSQAKTGGGISMGSFGPSFDRGSDLDEERVTWTLSIHQENQTLWQRSVSANNTGNIDLDDGVSGQAAVAMAAQQLQDNMWKNAATNLLNFAVPKYVFGPEAGSGLGSTKLNAK